MRIFAATLSAGILLASFGCHDNTPPPPRTPVPQPMSGRATYEHDRLKPLPSQSGEIPEPPYEDRPLVTQRLPEQVAFVNAYNAVGRPRITVLVTRTLRGLDSQAIENTLADWMSSNGQVTLISPSVARQKLTEDQIKGVENANTKSLGEVSNQAGVDVVIRAEAETTDQYDKADRIRLVCEALNTRDALSIGHAVVDVPLPLQKPQINEYTRYLARKLMDDMTGAWMSPTPTTDRPAATTSGSVPPTINDRATTPIPAVRLPDEKQRGSGAVVAPSTKP
ncbi:MAG TPA: hypothetical protein VL282_08210 [Tepidisphaeraceae bacterium]|nr:hypothetical protein [Tepidisphaeraceae bacterium]